MIFLIRKKVLFLCLTIAAIGCIIILCIRTFVPVSESMIIQPETTCYFIDPGHGGEDGGALSKEGVAESGINLAIATDLRELMRFLGYQTTMTRADENAIYSEEAHTLREKKRSDLENRAALVNACSNAVLVSIHQNSLPSSASVCGAQVFHNTVAPSEELAEGVQGLLNRAINEGQGKACKQIDSNIYLMRRAQCPAILVECGFLSNPTEARMLQQEPYQKKLAVVIAAGLLCDTEKEK